MIDAIASIDSNILFLTAFVMVCMLSSIRNTGPYTDYFTGVQFEIAVKMLIFMRDFLFMKLEQENEIMDTRLDNKQVIKTHILFGAKEVGRNNIDVFHVLNKVDYVKNRSRIMKLIGYGD